MRWFVVQQQDTVPGGAEESFRLTGPFDSEDAANEFGARHLAERSYFVVQAQEPATS